MLIMFNMVSESKSTVKVLTGQIRVVRVGSVRVNSQLGDVVLTWLMTC